MSGIAKEDGVWQRDGRLVVPEDETLQRECHTSTGAWSEFIFDDNSELCSGSFASKTRETYREKGTWRRYKQRQVDVLTKSSLRLPTIRTVVYIRRDL